MVSTLRRKVLQLAILSQLGVLLFVLKMAMAGLPNIEPVSLLVMVYAVTVGPWALVSVGIYVLLEYFTWGISLWSACYLYVWPALFAAAYLLRGARGRLIWAVLGGGFGLCFGALCSLTYWVTGGASMALSWWISGIPFDILHCAGNFVLALVLFQPLRRLLDKLLARVRWADGAAEPQP